MHGETKKNKAWERMAGYGQGIAEEPQQMMVGMQGQILMMLNRRQKYACRCQPEVRE